VWFPIPAIFGVNKPLILIPFPDHTPPLLTTFIKKAVSFKQYSVVVNRIEASAYGLTVKFVLIMESHPLEAPLKTVSLYTPVAY
jgi:hypothetical protein